MIDRWAAQAVMAAPTALHPVGRRWVEPTLGPRHTTDGPLIGLGNLEAKVVSLTQRGKATDGEAVTIFSVSIYGPQRSG